MIENFVKSLEAEREKAEILESIREQVKAEYIALSESKNPIELAHIMLEKIVEARYRLLQVDKMNRHLNSILDADIREMIRSSRPNVISIKAAETA